MTNNEKTPRKPLDFHIGCTDNEERKVQRVLVKLKEFAIYVDQSGDVRLEIDDDLENLQDYLKRLNEIAVQYAEIQGLEPGRVKKRSIYYLVARALTAGLRGNIETSTEMFALAKQRLLDYRIAQGRVDYVAGSSFAVTLIVFIFLINTRFTVFPSEWLDYINVFLGGAIGGQLSIAIRVRKIPIILESSRWSNRVEGFGRILSCLTVKPCSLFAI
ncbi:MAG: hypothetical protein ACPGVO_10530 [Spirulinaceae cyanobacterium]